MNFTCAILAGGKSTRMGKDKATFKFGNQTLIEQVYNVAHHVYKDIIIISSLHKALAGIEAPVLEDIIPVQSPLVGIASALVHAKTPYVFVLACDMPYVTKEAMVYMMDEVRGEDVVIPKTRMGHEPLHAIYNKSCLSYVLRCIEQDRMKIVELLPYLNTREVMENPIFFAQGYSVFTNINGGEDLSLAGSPGA
jgi:molybdopterin-guanine dinucleotide biosynthesis protein A